MAGRTGDVRMAQLLERAVGALYLGMIGGAIQAEEIVEIVVPWGRRRRRESRSALQVITNTRRFDQQTRSRPLIAITSSSDGSRSVYIPLSGTGISRYRYRHRYPVPGRYRIHPVPYPVPTLIRYRHPELDDGFGYWIPVFGYRYRQSPVPDDGPDDDRRTLLHSAKMKR